MGRKRKRQGERKRQGDSGFAGVVSGMVRGSVGLMTGVGRFGIMGRGGGFNGVGYSWVCIFFLG
ncbi:unnamed protein product [Prunus armeniaca]|uniref:Uncharacterized protein n=1 Tax=Prunus armeniaca TaxID=36596 RepID=A0A6J5WNE4_PRUAR|nr:unnamed protein product [Prunus armeniaca]